MLENDEHAMVQTIFHCNLHSGERDYTTGS